jgi:DNA-binding IclR family transcriptional regulator
MTGKQQKGTSNVEDLDVPSSTVTNIVRSLLRRGFQKPKQESSSYTSFTGLSFFSSRKLSKNETVVTDVASPNGTI